jgi:hypothetical protein
MRCKGIVFQQGQDMAGYGYVSEAKSYEDYCEC